jgi:hypothetical protein
MAQQTNTATMADETIRQRLDAVRDVPTAPLWIGTDTDTDQPVTISRQKPILITGVIGTGKTTLCHTISYQRLTPNSGLCYVTDSEDSLAPILLNGRDCTVIDPTTHADPIEAVPDDLGADSMIHGVLLDREPDSNTKLVKTLIEQLLQRPHDAQPYTLVLDGCGQLDSAHLPLSGLTARTRTLPLQVVITVQSLTELPQSMGQHGADIAGTCNCITGRVSSDDAHQLAAHYPTATPDDLEELSPYQWWTHQRDDNGRTDIQVTSPPPQLTRRDDY